jgi:hypothetical protein
MLAETATRNETFLGLMFPKMTMLRKWAKTPEDAQETVLAFVQLAEATKAEDPSDAMTAIQNLIHKFLQAELAKRSPTS